MRSALSSAAAPRASLDELLAGLALHGLDALELRVGDGHDIGSGTPPAALAQVARRLNDAGAQIIALLDESHRQPGALRDVLNALGARLLLGAALPFDERLARAAQAAAAGVKQVAIVIRGADLEANVRMALDAGRDIVWEAHPDDGQLAPLCDRAMEACGPALAGVRLCGGGPESILHEGRGIGAAMARLAIGGFDGSLTLAPSDRKYHVLWDTWVGRRGGWGCGSNEEASARQLERVKSLVEEQA